MKNHDVFWWTLVHRLSQSTLSSTWLANRVFSRGYFLDSLLNNQAATDGGHCPIGSGLQKLWIGHWCGAIMRSEWAGKWGETFNFMCILKTIHFWLDKDRRRRELRELRLLDALCTASPGHNLCRLPAIAPTIKGCQMREGRLCWTANIVVHDKVRGVMKIFL